MFPNFHNPFVHKAVVALLQPHAQYGSKRGTHALTCMEGDNFVQSTFTPVLPLLILHTTIILASRVIF